MKISVKWESQAEIWLIGQRSLYLLIGCIHVFISPIMLSEEDTGKYFLILAIYTIINVFESGATALLVSRIASSDKKEKLQIMAMSWFAKLAVLSVPVVLAISNFYFDKSLINWIDSLILMLAIALSIYNFGYVVVLESNKKIYNVSIIRIKGQLWTIIPLVIGLWYLKKPEVLIYYLLILAIINCYGFIKSAKEFNIPAHFFLKVNIHKDFLREQIKLFISYACGYFNSGFMVIILSSTYGAVFLAKTAWILTAISYANSLAISIYYTKIPEFSILISEKKSYDLRQLIKRLNKKLIFVSVSFLVFWLVFFNVEIEQIEKLKYSNGYVYFIILLTGSLQMFISAFATILRSTGREVIYGLGVFQALMQACIYLIASSLTPIEFFAIILVINLLIMMPILMKYRNLCYAD